MGTVKIPPDEVPNMDKPVANRTSILTAISPKPKLQLRISTPYKTARSKSQAKMLDTVFKDSTDSRLKAAQLFQLLYWDSKQILGIACMTQNDTHQLLPNHFQKTPGNLKFQLGSTAQSVTTNMRKVLVTPITANYSPCHWIPSSLPALGQCAQCSIFLLCYS